jgi:hypothetical protein
MDFTKSQIKTRFMMYVEEAGLDFSKYESLLPSDMKKTKLSPIASKSVPVENRLLDLINYFDLLSSSESTRNAFIEVLSDPKIQDDPRSKAYQQYFEKMSKKDPQVTLTKPNMSWLEKVLTYLGLSKPEVVEHINEPNTKDLFKNLYESIEQKKKKNGISNVLIIHKEEKGGKAKAISCKSLF